MSPPAVAAAAAACPRCHSANRAAAAAIAISTLRHHPLRVGSVVLCDLRERLRAIGENLKGGDECQLIIKKRCVHEDAIAKIKNSLFKKYKQTTE